MSVIDKKTEEATQNVEPLFVCLYTNSLNEVKVQCLRNAKVIASRKSEHIQGWSEQHNKPITLRADRVLSVFSSSKEAEEALTSVGEHQSTPVTLNLPRSKAFNPNEPTPFEICFSGFPAKQRAILEKEASMAGMIVHTRVTNNLDILCAGTRVGPAKKVQAMALGAFIIDDIEFSDLISTGELPEVFHDNESNQVEARSRVELDKLEKLQEQMETSFAGLKTIPRRENLIATFEDDRAVGWKFHVPSVFREALDIKKTPFTIHGQTRETWTQGHAYSFKVGDSIGSHSTKDWKQFLHQDNAMVLQVKYATPAGFDENKKFEGPVSGGFYASKTAKCPTDINGLNIIASSYTYDPGVLTVSIFKPNSDKTKVELFDTLVLDQVEFVTLLQLGYYWQKPESKEDDTKVKKITLIA